MKTFIVTATLLAAAVIADAASWVRADVYFWGWRSERAIAMSPEQLRDEARRGYSRSAHIISVAQLQQLVAVLDLPRLRPQRGDPRSDTFLLIDLFDTTGAHTTYRSDSFYLWSADSARGRQVDDHFRKFFEQLVPRPNQGRSS